MNCENCEESSYVIDKLAKLLAEIAVIVNGPEPPLTSWSYHDLPEKVRALKAPPAAMPAGYALVPVEPTEAMLDAGHAAAWRRIPSCFDMTDAEIVYRAMLAAALATAEATALAGKEGVLMKEPYTCKYCGQPSWLDPADQTPPVDYCHPSDHGEPDHGDPDEPTDN